MSFLDGLPDYGAEAPAAATQAPAPQAAAQPSPGASFLDSLPDYAGTPSNSDSGTGSAPVSPVAKALEPITSYPSTYSQMNSDARSEMATGIDQIKQGGLVPIAKGIGNTALGALNYVTSPINAALHTVVGKPIEENTGIPAPYTEFAASLALPGVGLPKLGTAAQGAIDASRVIPSREFIRGATARGYNAITGSDAIIDPAYTAAIADKTEAALKASGARPYANTPASGLFNIVDELRSPQSGKYIMDGQGNVTQAATPADLESIRRAAGEAYNGQNGNAVRIAKNAIDDAYVNLPKSPGAVVSGDAEGLAQTAQDARANAQAGIKSDQIKGIDDAADLKSASANSGANYDNNVRRRVANLLLDAKKNNGGGWSPDELDAMEGIVRGNPVANISRKLGNFLGGGGGLGHMLATGIGAHMGGAAGAMIANVAGPAFKGIENMAVAGKVRKLDEIIRAAAPAQADAATAARVKYAADKWGQAQAGARLGDAASLAKLEAASRGLAVTLQRNLGLDAQTMFGKLRELSPAQADSNSQQDR